MDYRMFGLAITFGFLMAASFSAGSMNGWLSVAYQNVPDCHPIFNVTTYMINATNYDYVLLDDGKTAVIVISGN